ncbi:MAG TPA: DUF5011 domain-containing protein [Clostridiales bacterium]|jgi:hypothetical protein|nr:DUF5011 domain-containing protein [Clostridiales bacterium]
MRIGSRRVSKRFFIILLVVILLIATRIYASNKVYRSVTLEAGIDVIDLSHFIKSDNVEGTFVTDMSTVDTTKPGQYEIKIRIGRRVYTSTLNIVDTIPPTAEVVYQKIPFGKTVEASSFVKNIVDATTVEISYLEKPDFEFIGDQDIIIVLKDSGGNETQLTAKLSIGMVHELVEVGVGTELLDIGLFLMDEKFTGDFVTDVSDIDLNHPGEYDIVINCDGRKFTSRLQIVDDIPPKADVVQQEIWLGDELDAQSFVENIEDHSEVTVSYKEKPNFNKVGSQEVSILLVDTSGNQTELKAPLVIVEDTEPPVIVGDNEKLVYVGEKVSYRKHVTVTDNRDENVDLNIDSSAVNLKKPGTYPVTYKATDSSGNTATKTINFIVKEKPKNYVSEDEVNVLADQILANIIKEGMSQREKARAIYDWTRAHIKYVNDYENNTDWVRAAYDGIKNAKGDCYAFFGTAKALLTRAGIDNLDIVKKGGGHYWSMVNLGNGWYHYDTTPRRTGGEFFMLTDAQLEAYSKKNKNSHVWDRNKYPATPEE